MRAPHSEGIRRRPEPRWTTEYDGRRRRRYRGRGRKGQLTSAEHDDADLALAQRELAEARELLRVAYLQPKVDRYGAIVRSEAIATALGRAALAARLVDDVCMRRERPCGDQLDDQPVERQQLKRRRA